MDKITPVLPPDSGKRLDSFEAFLSSLRDLR